MAFSEKSSDKGGLARYARQTVLPVVGTEGQRRLQRTRVLCVGVGGLGCPALLYLTAAGIGELGLIDDDCVDVSNLQRQVLFETDDQGKPKTDVALSRLEALNPDVKIRAHRERLGTENVLRVFQDYDIVLDGTDNFPTKYLINDAAVRLGLPVVYASVSGLEGYVSVFWASRGPCYRCLYPYPPKTFVPNCAESGVIGALTGIIGSLQAMETIKLALSHEKLRTLLGRVILVDTAEMNFREFKIAKDPACPVCSAKPAITELVEYDGVCQAEKGLDDYEIAADELSALEGIELIDVREKAEWQAGFIPGSRHIPLSGIRHDNNLMIPKDKLCVFYCHSGLRSREALSVFLEKGFTNVKHLKGGIFGWTGPTVRP